MSDISGNVASYSFVSLSDSFALASTPRRARSGETGNGNMAASHRMQRHLREALIEEVQKYQMLYNTSHENHRDNDMRDRAWLEISEKLGVNSETLKREWKILRDSLRQAIKKNKQEKAKKSKHPSKKWYFESKMDFLLPFMTKRPVYSRMPGSSTLSELKLDGSDVEDQSSRLPVERGDPFWNNEGQESDALELFFASVCQSTRRLPRKTQAKIKKQVLDVLLRAEEEVNGDSKADF